MKEVFLTVSETESFRIDKYLSCSLTDSAEQVFSRSAISLLFESGRVFLNGKNVPKSTKVRNGDSIRILLPEPKPLSVTAQNIPLQIPYEDDHLLVVNKPRGMVVHPAAGNPDGTLVNALLYYCGDRLSGINGVLRPGIVHRIDKDTSGLLVVAKDDLAHRGLAEQIKAHSFLREYQAIVYGRMKEFEGCINAPIGRDPKDRKRMAITFQNSKNAVTHYRVLDEFPGYSHLSFRLETGRTHQIRVHMASLGHPILADSVYASKKAESLGMTGQCLHAKRIGFVHPITAEYLVFDSELPEDFQSVLSYLRSL